MQYACRKLNHSRGLGLLEVLAAVAILSLAAASAFGVFTEATAWNRDASLRTQAIFFASGIIEELKARPDQVRVVPETPVEELGLELERPPGVQALVRMEEFGEGPDLYLVRVTVRWSDDDWRKGEVLAAVIWGSNR